MTRQRVAPRGAEPLASDVGKAVGPIVAAAILAILPSIWFGDSRFTTSLAVQALVFASTGVGFNLIFGCTNQLFLCVGALAGIGGYGAAILSRGRRCPSWRAWPSARRAPRSSADC